MHFHEETLQLEMGINGLNIREISDDSDIPTLHDFVENLQFKFEDETDRLLRTNELFSAIFINNSLDFCLHNKEISDLFEILNNQLRVIRATQEMRGPCHSPI